MSQLSKFLLLIFIILSIFLTSYVKGLSNTIYIGGSFQSGIMGMSGVKDQYPHFPAVISDGIGLDFLYAINEKLSLKSGVSYIERGYSGGFGSQIFKQLQIPLSARFRNENIHFGAGLDVNILTDEKISIGIRIFETPYNLSKYSLGGNFEIGHSNRISKSIHFTTSVFYNPLLFDPLYNAGIRVSVYYKFKK